MVAEGGERSDEKDENDEKDEKDDDPVVKRNSTSATWT